MEASESITPAPKPQDRGHLTVESVAGWLLLVGIFASSWNGLHAGGLQLVDLILVPVAALLAISAWLDGHIWSTRLPGWLAGGGVAVVIDLVFRGLTPLSHHYMSSRVQLHGLDWQGLGSGRAGLQWLVALILLPACVAGATKGQGRSVERVAQVWVWGAALSGLVALTDKLGATQISLSLIGNDVDYSGRQAGLSSHANSLGVACVLALPFALVVFRNRVVGFLAQALLLIGVILSGSRGAQVALIILVMAVPLLVPRARRSMLPLAIGSAVGLPLILQAMGGFSKVASTLFRFGGGAVSASDSDAERAAIAAQGIHDFTTHPIAGVGLSEITYAHNIYLQLASAGGLVMLTGMALYWGGAVTSSFQPTERALAISARLVILGWLILGLVENSLVDRFLYVPLGILAAVYAKNPSDYQKHGDVS